MTDDSSELTGLPTVVRHALWNEGIFTIEAVQGCTKERLLDLPNVGAQGVNTVIQ
jgi:hypothetical protein